MSWLYSRQDVAHTDIYVSIFTCVFFPWISWILKMKSIMKWQTECLCFTLRLRPCWRPWAQQPQTLWQRYLSLPPLVFSYHCYFGSLVIQGLLNRILIDLNRLIIIGKFFNSFSTEQDITAWEYHRLSEYHGKRMQGHAGDAVSAQSVSSFDFTMERYEWNISILSN